MSRPNLLGASAVIASASLILMLALLVTQGAAARAPTSPPTAARSISGPTVIAPEDPSCFAWDFANYTGADVDGLTLRLQGNHSVSAVYTESVFWTGHRLRRRHGFVSTGVHRWLSLR